MASAGRGAVAAIDIPYIPHIEGQKLLAGSMLKRRDVSRLPLAQIRYGTK
jgi:hypothetical protein